MTFTPKPNEKYPQARAITHSSVCCALASLAGLKAVREKKMKQRHSIALPNKLLKRLTCVRKPDWALEHRT